MNAQKRVLLVDDEVGVRQSWDRFLSDAGFDVTTAEDGERAIGRLKSEPVDVVVSDLKMPRMDGMELLRWLQHEQPDTPFILLTGYGSEEVERRVEELGGFSYLHKPVNPEALSAVITAALIQEQAEEKKRQARREEAPAPEVVPLHLDEPPVEELVARVRGVEARLAEAQAAPAVVAEPAAEEAEHHPGRIRTTLEVGGWLIAAPVLGLAFVVFLPVIGFGALAWTVGEALVKRNRPVRT